MHVTPPNVNTKRPKRRENIQHGCCHIKASGRAELNNKNKGQGNKMLEYWTVEWTDGRIACYLDLADAPPTGLFRRVLWRRIPIRLVKLLTVGSITASA